MELRIEFKVNRNDSPKVYYAFSLIDIVFINTYQTWGINITICNLFFSVSHEKKPLNE